MNNEQEFDFLNDTQQEQKQKANILFNIFYYIASCFLFIFNLTIFLFCSAIKFIVWKYVIIATIKDLIINKRRNKKRWF